MNTEIKKYLVWVIAVVTGIPGLYYLLRDPPRVFYHLIDLLYGDILSYLLTGDIPNQTMPPSARILTFLFCLVILLRPVSAYGLLKLKTWGKRLAIGTLSLDFIRRMVGFIYTWTYYDRHPEASKLLGQLKNTMASGKAQYVGYYNLIPSYIIAATCLISVVLLLCIDFRTIKKRNS